MNLDWVLKDALDKLVWGETPGPWFDHKPPNRTFVRENYVTPDAINVSLCPGELFGNVLFEQQ